MYKKLAVGIWLFVVMAVFCLLDTIFLPVCYGITSGIYESVSRPGMKLDLEEGDYDHWVDNGDQIVELQAGSYKIKGTTIYFSPQLSDIGQLRPSTAAILDDCRIRWGDKGVFVLNGCQRSGPAGQVTAHRAARAASQSFPSRWRIEKIDSMEVYIPENAEVRGDKIGLTISYHGARAGIAVMEDGQDQLESLVSACKPTRAMKGMDTWFYVCGQGARNKYLEVVTKGRTPTILTYVSADDMPTFKALSIAISSLKQVGTVSSGGQSYKVSFKKWLSPDRSFSIMVPMGWSIQGGTADLGRNGYVRIVQAEAPDKEAALVGYYFPFYQFSQTSYGAGGVQPLDAVSYIRDMFFNQLAQSYQITFDNLRIKELNPEPSLSESLTRQVQELGRQMGISASLRYEAVDGKATCSMNGRPYDIMILGVLQYTTMPLSGFGYSYSWGPAPIFVELAQRGQLGRWFSVFSKMASSWQVSSSWLASHNRRASVDARQTLRHYRNMAKMIHENAERRMQEGLQEWESRETQETEIFWDTYHALGGEERYDDPQTGEEIDVPTGADKYLYDRLSQTWIGIHEDQPGAQDLVEELKQRGFVELRPHSY